METKGKAYIMFPGRDFEKFLSSYTLFRIGLPSKIFRPCFQNYSLPFLALFLAQILPASMVL
jgi:hypothetical protein